MRGQIETYDPTSLLLRQSCAAAGFALFVVSLAGATTVRAIVRKLFARGHLVQRAHLILPRIESSQECIA